MIPRHTELERGVNAVVEITVPLDNVSVADHPFHKMAVAEKLMERVLDCLPDDLTECVGLCWEDSE